MKIERGQKIRKGYFGFYSDQVECINNLNHKVLWWYQGLWCLNENGYIAGKIKELTK